MTNSNSDIYTSKKQQNKKKIFNSTDQFLFFELHKPRI